MPDADGLNTLAAMGRGILKETKAKLILTPHLKEFTRLSCLTKEEVLADPVAAAEGSARETGTILLLKGPGTIAAAPFYVGFVQHDRTMSRRETYDYCAERTGFKAAAIRAVFMALAEFIKENQRKGNITYLDGIASIRNYVKGSFAGLAGPWVKGVNYLSVQAVEMEPFKTLLAAILPVNNSEGAKPTINTVLDETTLVYDVVTGTDVFSIAGSDLAPDTTKDDEYVALVDAHGVETKAIIDFSDLQNVKAHLESGLLAGEYTLKVYTRSGLGEEFGVHVASRKVVVE